MFEIFFIKIQNTKFESVLFFYLYSFWKHFLQKSNLDVLFSINSDYVPVNKAKWTFFAGNIQNAKFKSFLFSNFVGSAAVLRKSPFMNVCFHFNFFEFWTYVATWFIRCLKFPLVNFEMKNGKLYCFISYTALYSTLYKNSV